MARSRGELGVLRIDFEPRDEKLEPISWDEFSRNLRPRSSPFCVRTRQPTLGKPLSQIQSVQSRRAATDDLYVGESAPRLWNEDIGHGLSHGSLAKFVQACHLRLHLLVD